MACLSNEKSNYLHAKKHLMVKKHYVGTPTNLKLYANIHISNINIIYIQTLAHFYRVFICYSVDVNYTII